MVKTFSPETLISFTEVVQEDIQKPERNGEDTTASKVYKVLRTMSKNIVKDVQTSGNQHDKFDQEKWRSKPNYLKESEKKCV